MLLFRRIGGNFALKYRIHYFHKLKYPKKRILGVSFLKIFITTINHYSFLNFANGSIPALCINDIII